jgi:hypothetical protein
MKNVKNNAGFKSCITFDKNKKSYDLTHLN